MTKTQQAKALILKFPGTNCDVESVEALEIVGFEVQLVPIALAKPEQLQGVDLVMLAGGFSYGDYVMAGRLAQHFTFWLQYHDLRFGTAPPKSLIDQGVFMTLIQITPYWTHGEGYAALLKDLISDKS